MPPALALATTIPGFRIDHQPAPHGTAYRATCECGWTSGWYASRRHAAQSGTRHYGHPSEQPRLSLVLAGAR